MNQVITLSLTDEELNQFRTLVAQSQISELKGLVDLVVEKKDTDAFIRRRVYETLSFVSGKDINKIKDTHDLKWDLGLTLYHKRSLKNPFQRILDDLGSNGRISVKECEKLVKVIDCITLVKSKA